VQGRPDAFLASGCSPHGYADSLLVLHAQRVNSPQAHLFVYNTVFNSRSRGTCETLSSFGSYSRLL
jgi:hypothetical protein